jgi:hypothetical protein
VWRPLQAIMKQVVPIFQAHAGCCCPLDPKPHLAPPSHLYPFQLCSISQPSTRPALSPAHIRGIRYSRRHLLHILTLGPTSTVHRMTSCVWDWRRCATVWMGGNGTTPGHSWPWKPSRSYGGQNPCPSCPICLPLIACSYTATPCTSYESLSCAP